MGTVNELKEEVRRTLILVTNEPSSRGRSGVSLNYLREHLGIDRQRLAEILEMLEQAGHVQVERFGRVILVTPTLQGHEKADQWRQQEQKKSWLSKIPSPVKWVAGIIIPALIMLFLWWIGLSPQTTGLRPLSATVPIRLYDAGTTPTSERRPWSWFRFSSAPDPEHTVYASSWEDVDALFSEDVPVTFDGLVHMRFDMENVATRYQVNIVSVLVQVTSEPIRDPEDVFFYQPALGGGEVWRYQLGLSPESHSFSEKESQIHEAVLISDGRPVDYIYLRPNERESVEISVDLGTPGNYALTPIVNYTFRKESKSVRADSYRILYPRRYRIWVWDQTGTPAGRKSPVLTHDIIADTQSGQVQIAAMLSQARQGCLSPTRWIAFESSMLDHGSLDRLFVIDTDGHNLRMIGPRGLHTPSRYLEWTGGNELLVSEPLYDETLADYVHEMRLFEPATGIFLLATSDEVPAVEHWYDDGPWREACLQTGIGCFVTRALDDTNGDGEVDLEDARQIYLDRRGSLTRLGYGSQDQAYLALSPDERYLAFVQGEKLGGYCGSTDRQWIYVMSVDGSALRPVTDVFGWYKDLAWSPNGQYLAFISARPADNGGELVCSESSYHVFVLDMLTGNEVQLTSGPLSDSELRWSGDGELVVAGGERLSLSRFDGSCSQDVFVPPVGRISNVLIQP